jgi:hypothetical protein
MKNLKKKLLSFALVASVVLSSTNMAFAGSLSNADKLNILSNLGIITGEGNGVIGTQTMTRYRAFVMQLKLMGKYDEMNNFAWEGKATFKDINSNHSQFIRKLAAYLKAHPEIGIAGDHLGNLNPMAPITGREYMKIMLVRLGYVENVDFTWTSIPTFAQDKGLVDYPSEVEGTNIQLLQIADFTYDTLMSKPVGSDKTLGEQLGLVSFDIALDKVDSTTENETITVSGSMSNQATVTVNGKEAVVNDKKFTADVALSMGENLIKIVAVDSHGIKVEKTIKVVREYNELKVLKVVGHNLKQFTIEFSRELDKDTVTNSRLGLASNDIFEISKDGKSVLVTLDSPLRQTTDTKYTIKDIKDTTGKKIAKTEIVVNVFDNELPEVKDVKVKGNQSITVIYSEPVENADVLSSYRIDESLVRGSVEANNTKTEFTINFKAPLEDGDHVLTITSDVEDAAGFNLKAIDIDFTVVKDEEAPEAEIISASQTKVLVEFNEEIKAFDKSYVSWKSGSKKGYADSVTQSKDNDLVYEITFAEGNYVPLNGATLIIENVKDFSGNVAKKIELNFTPDVDLERPEVIDVETDENNQNILYVTYNEDVNTNGKYVLIDKDEKEKTATAIAYAEDDVKNKIKVTFSSIAAGDYTLEISEVTDLSPLANELLPTLKEVTIEDLERVTIEAWGRIISGDNKRILIKFSEEVDEDKATNLDNYKFRFASGALYSFPEDTQITLLGDEKTVEIILPAEWKLNGTTYDIDDFERIEFIQVEKVTDLSGNAMYAQLLTLDEGRLTLEEQAPVVVSAAVIEENIIELELNNPIDEKSLDRRDFIVELASGSKLNVYRVDYSDSDDDYKLTLYVREKLDQNGKFDESSLRLSLADSVSTKNIYSSALTLAPGLTIDDKYNPEATVASAVYENQTEITFEVGEEVQFGFGDGLSLVTTETVEDGVTTVTLEKGSAANDLLISRFTVRKGSSKLAIEKIQIIDATKIVIVINDGDEDWDGDRLEVTFNGLDNPAYSITDTSGNILKNFDNVEVSIENIN